MTKETNIVDLNDLLEEIEVQKKMFESVLDKMMELEAKIMALTEVLVVNDVIDEVTVEALEQESFKELLLEQFSY